MLKEMLPRPTVSSYGKQFQQVAHELKASKLPIYYDPKKVIAKLEAFETINALPCSEKLNFIKWVLPKTEFVEKRMFGIRYIDDGFRTDEVAMAIISLLLRGKMDCTTSQLLEMLELFIAHSHDVTRPDEGPGAPKLSKWPLGYLATKIQKPLKQGKFTKADFAHFTQLLKDPRWQTDEDYPDDALLKAHAKLLNCLSMCADETQLIKPYEGLGGDPFGDLVAAELPTLAAADSDHWHALFHLCVSASGSKPSKKFLSQCDALIDAIGTTKFKNQMHRWVGFASRVRLQEIQKTCCHSGVSFSVYDLFHTKNQKLLKGLAWSLLRFHDAATLQIVADLAATGAQKIPGEGPAAQGLTNACLYVLAHTKGLAGVAHLSRLKLRIRQNNTQKLIGKYIGEQADKRGLKPAQIEEMAAPDFGLNAGVRTWPFDDYTLRLTVQRAGVAHLQWIKPCGAVQKSTPAFVRSSKDHADRLKAAKAVQKAAKQTSTVQRDRIDRLFVEDMNWAYDDFAAYYLDHGLVAVIARKMIWTLQTDGSGTPAIWQDGGWQDVNGHDVQINGTTIVSLWHPIGWETSHVLAWRDRLEALQIVQPMKQAHREVYLLTAAELETTTYSNRMAAHILKQHQFNSLAALRGWSYGLLGAYDDGRAGEVARKELKAHGLRAEFWIDELFSNGDEEYNEVGIWTYVATDQIRFVNMQNDQPLQLVDVPALLLSETMRDADLFVGVASVGNDPNWLDGGGEARAAAHGDYWNTYSFGDLSEVAKTRASVLERLLPKLKIRDVAHIDGKFLLVDGTRHTYKIHIGSTNILIAPADKYLCIVPGRSVEKAMDRVCIPFEGDRGLSIVLSKAFMLAQDDKITDPTILSQL